MSAYICSDKHIATIAVAFTSLLAKGADTQPIADELLRINTESVNYRYNEDTPVETVDLTEAETDRSFEDLVALCGCLNYQSCELPDYKNPLLDSITAQFKANCRTGVESPVWSI
ncbi:MAG: hypothetical protein ABTQ25_02460 [Nitrosomonas ureae]